MPAMTPSTRSRDFKSNSKDSDRRFRRIAIIVIVASGLLIWGCNYFLRWVWQPPLSISGQVVNAETGEGLPDVFVIVNHEFDSYQENPERHWYQPGTWYAEGGAGSYPCAPYSRVLLTDAQGRYHLSISIRDAFGNQRFPSLKMRAPILKFYKPGWRNGLQAGRSSRYLSNSDQFAGPLPMQRAPADLNETLENFDFVGNYNCDQKIRLPDENKPLDWKLDPSWLTFYEAHYQEIWAAWCGDTGKDDFGFSSFAAVVARLDQLRASIDASQLGLSRAEYAEFLEQRRKLLGVDHDTLREAATEYPWSSETWTRPIDLNRSVNTRPFYSGEKSAVCEVLRLENYATKEHRP
jgi:hypothetical protein